MAECTKPGCDVILKQSQKSYCCREHHREHQKMLRMNTPGKGKGSYHFIDADLKDRFASIDAKVMKDLEWEDSE